MKYVLMTAVASGLFFGGCIQVKTESEIKPIHITMDVNLKMDKELDRKFADERSGKSDGDFKLIRSMLDRGVAGYTNRAMLEEREGATDDDRIVIAESNSRRMKRFAEVAKESGTSIEAAQRRHLAKLQERIPAGSGVWMQSADGKWARK